MAEETHLVLRNDTAELLTATAALSSFCEQHGINEGAVFDLTLALEEIFTNIIRHGSEDRQPHETDLVIRKQDDWLTLRVADDGRPFDPSKAAPPDLGPPPEKRAVGGLGIHLLKSLTFQSRKWLATTCVRIAATCFNGAATFQSRKWRSPKRER